MKRAFSLSLVAALAAISFSSTSRASTQADEIFQKAIAADQAGDVAERDRFLSVALKADPDHQLARWYSGQVLHNGKWQSLGTIERTVSSDSRWHKYQGRVDSSEDSLADHADLARWCRSQGLQLEEKWHWIHVLRHDPGNREALGALGLRIFKGSYASPEQIAVAEAKEKKAKIAFKHHSELLRQAMREAERTDGTTRVAALRKISAISDPAAIQAIVEVVLADAKNEKRILEKLGNEQGEMLLREMQFAGIAALSNMPEHEATQSLLEIALYASDKGVRAEAAGKLKHREPTSFMPQLMAGLSAPIELEVSVHTLPNGEITVYEDFTEKGPLATKKHSRSSVFLTQHVNIHTNATIGRSGTASSTSIAGIWSDQWRDMANATAQVTNTQDRVELENAIRKERNARIERVLELASDKKLGEDPEAWWNDWKNYNELYTPEVLPVAETRESYDYSSYLPHYTQSTMAPVAEIRATAGRISLAPEDMPYRYPEVQQRRPINLMRPRSCFIAGTVVWTQSGPVAIEKISVGEFVLSQNPHSGELSYRPVIDTMMTPEIATIRLTLNDEDIIATGGHRLWVAGEGWRMARLIEPGDSLFAASGTIDVQAAKKIDRLDVYNLEVGEFHTYFVGKNRVLVHDNTCPQPTINVLPGISPRAEVAPPQLAMQN